MKQVNIFFPAVFFPIINILQKLRKLFFDIEIAVSFWGIFDFINLNLKFS